MQVIGKSWKVVLVASALWMAPAAQAQTVDGGTAAAAPVVSAPEAAQVVSLAVVGRLTPGWAVRIREALANVGGVDLVDVNTEEKKVNVSYRASLITPQKVADTIKAKSGVDVTLVRHAVFQVRGMVNPNCPVLVRKALEGMDGVVGVRASLAEGKAWVDYLGGTVTSEEMAARVKDRAGIDMDRVGDGN